MNEVRSSANAVILLLVASGGTLAACGSTSNGDLFRPVADAGGTSGRAGSGQGGVFGIGGANGAAGNLGAGGIAGASGAGSNGASGAGAGGSGTNGASGAGAGAGGATGIGAGAGTSGTAGDAGSGATGGSQGVGGADGGSTGGNQGMGGSSGSHGAGGSSAGGTSGSSGSTGTGGSGGASQPPCLNKASQTVLIGDSYVNWVTHSFRADLARLTGESWRLYASGGAAMATGGLGTLIPQQFENAVRSDSDIRVVVMDGGGNDILLPASSWAGGGECNDRMDSPNLPVCRQIVQTSIERERMLMDRMADVGVRDVVFFFYPIVPNGTVLGGRYPNAISGWARPQVKEQCDGTHQRTGGRLRCHFVDLVPVFEGHPEYFATGDIHPDTSGSAAMARAVWNAMKSACIGQKPSSGCCQP